MISIRVDSDLKQSFDALCKEFGLSSSATMTLFMKAVVRERKIPFEIKADPGPSHPYQDFTAGYGVPDGYMQQGYMPQQGYAPTGEALSNTLYQGGALFDSMGGQGMDGQRKMTLDDISYETVHARLNGKENED